MKEERKTKQNFNGVIRDNGDKPLVIRKYRINMFKEKDGRYVIYGFHPSYFKKLKKHVSNLKFDVLDKTVYLACIDKCKRDKYKVKLSGATVIFFENMVAMSICQEPDKFDPKVGYQIARKKLINEMKEEYGVEHSLESLREAGLILKDAEDRKREQEKMVRDINRYSRRNKHRNEY